MDLTTMLKITTSIDELPHFSLVSCKDPPCANCEKRAKYGAMSLESLRVSAQGSCQICRLQYLGLLQVFGPCRSRRIYLSLLRPYTLHLTESWGSGQSGKIVHIGTLWMYTKAGQPQCPWLPVGVGRDVPTRRYNYAETVRGWLRACQDLHPACTSKGLNAALPSRVIDVAHDESDIVRLTETSGEQGRYLALSHCWGGKVPLQTESKNYADMMTGINFNDLPRTFQDAVTVTRDLGQRYLWIDALCIIQDDSKDWEQESGNMAAIYQNAYMVIGADMSVNSHGGFLESDGSYNKDGEPFALIDDHDNSKVTTIYAREHKGHYSQCLMLPLNGIKETTPLSQRAWTLQEQFLATRMAHFDSKEIIWQCDSAVFCECMDLDNSIKKLSGRHHFLESLNLPSGAKYKAWYSIVDDIIQRSITKPDDILPALSGLARMIQDSGGGRYLAGLWLDDLPSGLLWWVENDHFASRATPFRAPSWSWASVQYQREIYKHGGGETDPGIRLDPTWATVKEAVSKPKGADPLGAVAGGYLEVYAPVLEAAIESLRKTLVPLGQSADLDCWLSVYFDFEFDLSDKDVLYCLFVGQMTHGGSGFPTRGLILKRLTGSSEGSYDGHFERVGMFGTQEGAFSEYEQFVRWSTVTIV